MSVVVSSAGRRVALVRCLEAALQRLEVGGDVVAVDMSRTAPAFHAAGQARLVPRCTADGFIGSILEICRATDVKLVVPTIDTELPAYARSVGRFEEYGVKVVTSSPRVVQIAADKVATHSWLVDNGFPTVQQASRQARGLIEDWASPVIAKPVRGSASIGVRKIASMEELEALPRDVEYIVQTIAPGREHTVDVFIDADGVCRCAIPRRRLEVRAGEVSKGVTVRVPAVEELAFQIAEALPGARGVLNIQIFHDPGTDECRVIEINPRFGGGFPLSHRAGADFPLWLLQEAHGLPVTANNDWQEGVVMLRWDDAVFVDHRDAGVDL